ncbi:MAG TPA: hypothetical protein VJ781_07755 [Pyrinomonadaceae bacterium]|jgi:hypothetical protein|nr:hypothetical protein [Pyrinomonadaceae bacterium]
MAEKSKPDTKKQDRPPDDEDSEKEGERSYYYDDAHGYKDFDPDEDEEFED